MYGSNTLVPTCEECFLQDTNDAFLLIQSVIDKRLPITRARPTEQNRRELIKSGNVFVIDMKENYIARWTDGLTWSPSRILGDFLIYRERRRRRQSTRGSVPKKGSHSLSSSDSQNSISQGSGNAPGFNSLLSNYDLDVIAPSHPLARQGGRDAYLMGHDALNSSFRSSQVEPNGTRGQNSEYNLYGSLTSNDQYKEDGLIKKTFSVPFRQSVFRLVSYYLPKDVETGKLRLPSRDPRFANVQISDELSETKNVRMPVAVPQGDMFHSYDAGADLLYNSTAQANYALYQAQRNFEAPIIESESSRSVYRGGSYVDCHNAVGPAQVNNYIGESGDLHKKYYFKDSPRMQSGMLPRPRSSSISTIPSGRQPALARGTLPSRQDPMAQLPVDYNAPHTISPAEDRHLTTSASTSMLNDHSRNSSKRNSVADYRSGPTASYDSHEHLQLGTTELTEKHHKLPSSSFRLSEYEDKSSTDLAGFSGGGAGVRSNVFNTMSPSERNPLQGEVGQSGKISASVISQESDTYDQLYQSMSPRSDQVTSEMSSADQERFYSDNLDSSVHPPVNSGDEFASNQSRRAMFMPTTTTAPYDIPRH